MKAFNEKSPAASLPYFQHAVELDPNFAFGYSLLGTAYLYLGESVRCREYLTKAFQLREHASEYEKLAVTGVYYPVVSG